MKGVLFLASVLLMMTATASLTAPISSAYAITEAQPSSASVAASVRAVEPTSTPIKHVVVLFQENVSYDHYFATYPNATNITNEPSFTAGKDTPSTNGLTKELIDNNPNSAKPFRLDRTQFKTCDQNHDYKPEQEAYNGGLLDMFVEKVGASGNGCDPKEVMGYYDGNTVTALWNYAQHFAMSDNSYSTTFGPSTPGALNLISGQTHGATPDVIPDGVVNGTVIGDPDGAFDDCSKGSTVAMSGKNVGDLLNKNNVTWGWFEGGFKPTSMTSNGTAVCGSFHMNLAGDKVTDYSAHHEPFQYYASTSNPHHLPPTSIAMIGKTDQANHQYDLADFWNAADSGNMPAVSFLKAAKYQDGHAAYSSPLDEQKFLTTTINHLQKLPEWSNTAVIILYDDSDGWYDHMMPPIVSQSGGPEDYKCGNTKPGAFESECGYGPRQPLLVISPYAKINYIDHHVTDISSVLRFIEDNWQTGRMGNNSFDAKAGSIMNMFDFAQDAKRALPLFLDYNTGNVIQEEALKVQALDKDGKQIQGIWTIVGTPEGVAVAGGYTPFSFVGAAGSKYMITMSNFDSKQFQRWEDNGSTNMTRIVTLGSNGSELTARYDTDNSLRGFTPLTFAGTGNQSSLTIKATLLEGGEELHMWSIISPQAVDPSSSANSNSTTYKLYASNFGDHIFDHWSDGNRERVHNVAIAENTTVTAYYKQGYAIASGDVTNTTAVVWSRFDKPATMHLAIDIDPSYSHAIPERTTTVNGSSDFAGHIKLDGLSPDTKYYYKVWFTSAGIGGSTIASTTSTGTFRTAPNESESKPISFVVGGDLAGQQYCSRVDENFPIFTAMKAANPDFFIFNGDEIYADNYCPASGPEGVSGWNNIPGDFPKVNDPSVNWTNYEQVRSVYLKHWQYNRADPNFQSFLRNVSMYSQADDHEVANNWAPSSYYSNTTMSRAGFPNLIKAGLQEFFSFSPIDKNPDDSNRIYRSFHWGKNADLFIVDQHQYRSRNDLPDIPSNNKTLLGKEQLAWLEQGLLSSKATWKIVSLDDPMTIPECVKTETATTPLGCDNFATDGKSNLTFTRERNEFLKFLDDNNIKNVVFLVTDVHFAGNILVEHDFNGDGKNLVYHELATGPLSASSGEPDPVDPTINAKYLYKEGPMFSFGYYKVQPQDDGNAHFVAEVRGVDGGIRAGSQLDLVPQ